MPIKKKKVKPDIYFIVDKTSTTTFEHDIFKLDRIFFQVTITFNNMKNLLCYGRKVVNASSINVKKAIEKTNRCPIKRSHVKKKKY